MSAAAPAVKIDTLIRALLAMAVALLALLIIGALLWLMDTALSVWERLMAAPDWLMATFWTLLAAIVVTVFWLSWRLLVPRRRSRRRKQPQTLHPAERLTAAEQRGVDVSGARRELDRLQLERAGGEMTLGLLGDMSSGKSTLVRALLPDADVVTDVRGGTTERPQRYRWTAPSGDVLTLVDIPGTGAAADDDALDEAQRCHMLLYVCEGDLTRSQFAALSRFLALEKPSIVVVNKSDRFSAAELDLIVARLQERLRGAAAARRVPEVVSIVAGGDEQVVDLTQGEESVRVRRRDTHVEALVAALSRLLATSPELLESLRDQAVFALVLDRLDAAEARFRQSEAERIVAGATRRAVIGALAAVGPGTDILIQGYLGTRMVRQLCELYDVPPKDLDVERFLDLGQSRLGATLPIVLAVAGNGLKAFPGAGTVAGGLLHAVAYGLIFDALGRSLSGALADSHALIPEQAVARFEEHLGADLSSRATAIARLALHLKDDQRAGGDR